MKSIKIFSQFLEKFYGNLPHITDFCKKKSRAESSSDLSDSIISEYIQRGISLIWHPIAERTTKKASLQP